MLFDILRSLFTKSNKETKPSVASITDPYRVNRIVRSEWKAGNCEQINYFHHYSVCIDGEYHRFGIAEILSAIEALEKHESYLKLKNKQVE